MSFIKKASHSAVVAYLIFASFIAFGFVRSQNQSARLQHLVRVECVRSRNGAALRVQIIQALTEHVALQPHSSPSLVQTVNQRNMKLDQERAGLLATGKKIPVIKC